MTADMLNQTVNYEENGPEDEVMTTTLQHDAKSVATTTVSMRSMAIINQLKN